MGLGSVLFLGHGLMESERVKSVYQGHPNSTSPCLLLSEQPRCPKAETNSCDISALKVLYWPNCGERRIFLGASSECCALRDPRLWREAVCNVPLFWPLNWFRRAGGGHVDSPDWRKGALSQALARLSLFNSQGKVLGGPSQPYCTTTAR
jgi:hypothetical protein